MIYQLYVFVQVSVLLLTLLAFHKVNAQDFWQNAEEYNPKRLRLVGWGAAGATAATYTSLGLAWYGQSQWQHFRIIDDADQWQQIDKMGHAFGAYQISRGMMASFKWTGASEKQQFWYGGLSGFLFQLPVEIFDGFSEDYGASLSDIAFNTAGSGLALLNRGLWKEERIGLRFSYHPTSYAAKAPNILGSSPAERLLKDYNGQTYWLTTSVGAWLPNAENQVHWPRWLAVSVGMGGEGMLGGYGRLPRSQIQQMENRQYYLSFDIDWTRIPTRNGWVRALLFGLNTIKLPAPALEWNARQGFVGHAVFF